MKVLSAETESFKVSQQKYYCEIHCAVLHYRPETPIKREIGVGFPPLPPRSQISTRRLKVVFPNTNYNIGQKPDWIYIVDVELLSKS